MINIDKYVIPHNRQHRFNTHAPKYKVECVCLRSVTGDLRDYTPPLNLPLTLCNGNSVLYNYGQPLKEVWKCVQLALYSPVSNPFWAHKGALLNNGKSGEKGQLQAWPRCLRTDFMHRKRRLCARMHVHTFLRVSARVCACVHAIKRAVDMPVSLLDVPILHLVRFADNRRVCKMCSSQCEQRVNLVRRRV